MKNKFLPKLVVLAVSGVLMSGCVHTQTHEALENDTVKPLKALNDISKAYQKTSEGDDLYVNYTLNPEHGDLLGLNLKKRGKIKEVSMDSSVGEAISYLSSELNVSVVYDVYDKSNLDKKIRLNLRNGSYLQLVKMIERSGNVDIYFNDGVLVISDLMTVEGTFSKLELDDGVYSSIKKHLEKLLTSSEPSSSLLVTQDKDSSKSSKSEVTSRLKPEVIIDKETGAFYIKSQPEQIRRSKSLIERFINTAVSHANIELAIYRINNEKARNIGISVDSVVKNLYSLSLGASASGIIDKSFDYSRSVTKNNGDVLGMGLSLYEQNGIIKTESKTILTVFNSVEAKLSDVQTVGYWTPGDLRENNTIVNGASVTTYTEDKPTFTEEDVGKKLVLTPRIDLRNKIINMKVSYSESSVYKEELFTWKRNTNLGDIVEIKKPLKTENNIDSQIVVTDDKYSILAGMKSKTGDLQRQFIPGTGEIPIFQDIGSNSSSGSVSDALIVIKAKFPNKVVNQNIHKLKISLGAE